jgi:hypothetical protein
LRIATVAPIVRVPEVLAMYHFHGGVQASSQKARAALHHLIAQQRFLAEHPQFIAAIGAKRAHDLMLGELLNRGYACYWERDLTAARQIFRVVMRHGYGTLRDWGRMLPAWLPQSWHAGLTSINDACRPGRK